MLNVSVKVSSTAAAETIGGGPDSGFCGAGGKVWEAGPDPVQLRAGVEGAAAAGDPDCAPAAGAVDVVPAEADVDDVGAALRCVAPPAAAPALQATSNGSAISNHVAFLRAAILCLLVTELLPLSVPDALQPCVPVQQSCETDGYETRGAV